MSLVNPNVAKVTNVRQFTNADIQKLEHVKENQDLDFLFNVERTDKELEEGDYIIADLVLDGEQYVFIHGFPGDEPVGILYKPDFSEITSLHHSIDRGFDKQNDWYLDSTTFINDEDNSWDSEIFNIPKDWFVEKEHEIENSELSYE